MQDNLRLLSILKTNYRIINANEVLEKRLIQESLYPNCNST